MITGDYVEKKRVNKKGQLVTDKVVTADSGVQYAIGPRLGKGGVAAVYKCRRCSDGKMFAFKEYVPDPLLKGVHYMIQKNLRELIANPIKDSNGNILTSFVRPLEIVNLKASHGFGYVMDLVDTKNYTNYGQNFKNSFPDAYTLCELGKNLTHLFEVLHLGRGWCYKDINEGNIYLNLQNGEILIIDCDNISVPKRKTIVGTPGYMAPEVYLHSTPDTRTDDHSMAVYLYRLLTWSWPLDGKYTYNYLIANNANVFDAAPIIYGTEATFAFDPKNTRNSARGMGIPESKLATLMWDNLPEEIQKHFITTFGEGLKRREARTTPTQWRSTFDKVQKTGLVTCPKCGKRCFGSEKKGKKCIYCDAKLPVLKPVPVPVPTPVPNPTPVPVVPKELESVQFSAQRAGLPTVTFTAKRKAELPGSLILPSLPKASLFKVQYNKAMHQLALVNLSSYEWIVTDNGKKSVCRPGERQPLKPGMIITIIRRTLQLTVTKIQ